MTSRTSISPLDTFVAGLPADGLFSMWCGPLVGDAWTTRLENEPHYAASTMKLALVIAAYRRAEAGAVDLDALVQVHDGFASVADGSPFRMDRDDDGDPEPWRRLGHEVTLRWLALRSIVRSSNLATNLLLEVVGLDAVHDTLSSLGTAGSTVERGIEDARAREAGLQNLVTAADLARTLRQLAAAPTVTSAASAREILAMLAAQQYRDTIPAGLPPGTKVAHKSGWVDGISHDAGIVYPQEREPFVFVMCTSSALTEQEGRALIAAGAAAAWAEAHA